MNKGLRLFQPSLIVFLLISVCTLVFVAYTQHEEQQRWKGKYDNAIQFQQYWESKYQDAVAQLPVTLSLSWFSNMTDVYKTEFKDNLCQPIEPVKIEVHKWNAVTFWFEKREVGNGTVLLHLPNQNKGSYTSINVPFFDISLWTPATKMDEWN
jgi:hypothetical protein